MATTAIPSESASRLQPAAARRSPGRSRLDWASFTGLLLALGGIIGGLLLEKGTLADISQVTAAMIVFGGTLGAVLVTTPIGTMIEAVRRLPLVFLEPPNRPDLVIEEILAYAAKARKSGIVSLEQDADAIEDYFLRKALNLAVDGTDLEDIRKLMEIEMAVAEQQGESCAKVYESAGGYAPTIGIIGAVLGLIQVMKHLENMSEVGSGIAVAFVATVYGVASANIFFLPAANKLRARMRAEIRTREVMLEGVAGIVEGLNPKLIRIKLEPFVRSEGRGRRGGRGTGE